MPNVNITGWSKGFKSSTCTDLLQSLAGLPSTEAKRIVESVLSGQKELVSIASEADARLFIRALHKLGASAQIEST